MGNMSIRGVDERTLAKLKRQAQREGVSVNTLVVSLLRGESGQAKRRPLLRKYDDLDALAGTWTAKQVEEFERVTAPFAEVDAELWR